MTQNEMKEFVETHRNCVPQKNHKFDTWNIEKQFKMIQFYIESDKQKRLYGDLSREARRFVTLCAHAHFTVADYLKIIEIAKSRMDDARKQQIDDIDSQIAKLQALKESLNK